MSEPQRGCLTCKWADYLKTPTGKLKRGEVVLCRFRPPTEERLALALVPLLPSSMLGQIRDINFRAHGMWPDQGQDGSDCTKWEPKE